MRKAQHFVGTQKQNMGVGEFEKDCTWTRFMFYYFCSGFKDDLASQYHKPVMFILILDFCWIYCWFDYWDPTNDLVMRNILHFLGWGFLSLIAYLAYIFCVKIDHFSLFPSSFNDSSLLLLFFFRISTGTSSRAWADLGFSLNKPLSNERPDYSSINSASITSMWSRFFVREEVGKRCG